MCSLGLENVLAAAVAVDCDCVGIRQLSAGVLLHLRLHTPVLHHHCHRTPRQTVLDCHHVLHGQVEFFVPGTLTG